MAEGKYLSALAVLHAGTLISDKHLQERLSAVCNRLAGSALPMEQEGKAWGLGFVCNNLPADEPYLITTALVCKGLLQCRRQGGRGKALDHMLSAGQRGLLALCRQNSIPAVQAVQASFPVVRKAFSAFFTQWPFRTIRIPLYSPGIREPVYNAAATAAACLMLLAGEQGKSDAEYRNIGRWIHLQKIAHLGWAYAPGNPTVDLLHQCYILNALADIFGAPAIEEDAAAMLGQFYGCGGLADVLKLENSQSAADSEKIFREIDKMHSVQVLQRPARLWSLGELLVLVARLGREGRFPQRWLRQGQVIAQDILARMENETDPETSYPRHIMHVVHGLSCYLALLRALARKKREQSDGISR
jgi:hypothetical protein